MYPAYDSSEAVLKSQNTANKKLEAVGAMKPQINAMPFGGQFFALKGEGEKT